jgi:hypothetical protein
LRWSARLFLLETNMEPLLADLGIHRLICRAGDNRIKPVVVLQPVAVGALTSVKLCRTVGEEKGPHASLLSGELGTTGGDGREGGDPGELPEAGQRRCGEAGQCRCGEEGTNCPIWGWRR